MTRGDSSSDTESVQHHVEEDMEEDVAGVHPLEIDEGRSDVGSAVSEDVETGDNLEPDPEVREVIVTPTVRAALVWLDEVDLVEAIKQRASGHEVGPEIFGGSFPHRFAHSFGRSHVGR